MSDDEIDTEIEEGYDEFIKEYGSRYNEGNPGFIPEWKEWDDLFCEIKIYWSTKAVRHWKEKALKQFVHSLPNVRNPSSLFHVFIHSNAFYLPHILSLIELPYSAEELRWKIWPCGITINDAVEIEKLRCEILLQGEDSITDYYSKIKRYNDNVNLCEKHLKREFIRGLSPKVKCFALIDFDYDNVNMLVISPWDLPLDVLVKMLIQKEKDATTKQILQPCLDFISQQQRLAIYKTSFDTYLILDTSVKNK